MIWIVCAALALYCVGFGLPFLNRALHSSAFSTVGLVLCVNGMGLFLAAMLGVLFIGLGDIDDKQ
jgi:hypothetical protein